MPAIPSTEELVVVPPESVTIRRLGVEDVEPMRALLETFGEAFDKVETFRAHPSGAEYLQRLLGSECFICLAALDGDSVVGGLAAYELRKYEREWSEVYIYDLAVAARYRRRGIATALIEALKPIAAERGAWVIFVQADVGDEAAIALYEGLGTREDVHHFDIPVE